MWCAVFLLLLHLTSGFILDNQLDAEWNGFKALYAKAYTQDEEAIRRGIWEQNLILVNRQNNLADNGLSSFRMGTFEFSDMTAEEFIGKQENFLNKKEINSSEYFLNKNLAVPETVDWREAGLVTPIKNQGTCGSCWAFAAVGALEGQHKKRVGDLVSLSEQNLIDCSIENDGCGGGDPNLAFMYVKNNKGINSEVTYAYSGKNGTCRFDRKNVAATCTGFLEVEKGDEEALKQAVATMGPIAVTIDACHNSFFQYKSGIFDEPTCRTDIPSHAMLIIGYGTENGKDYWLLKNSFGVSWGIDGFIKMSRNKQNQCGIAERASFPLV